MMRIVTEKMEKMSALKRKGADSSKLSTGETNNYNKHH